MAQEENAPFPELSAAEIQNLERLADVYGVDRAAAQTEYETVLGQDFSKSLKSIDFFAHRKAYEILALAIPKLDGSVQAEAISATLKKNTFSLPVCQAFLEVLEQVTVKDSDNDEERTGFGLQEKIIATALARWLALPDPRIAENEGRLGILYRPFIAQARQKMADMPNSSPH